MIYVTGDTHGFQSRWVDNIMPLLSRGDILIICGDFGVGFWNGRYWSEETFYDYIEQQDYQILFVDGNHCDFNKLNSYPVEMWNGGKVHKIRRNNLIHLMRGQVYHIENFTLFSFGGGYSIDKAFRKEGYDWWPQEMPNDNEYNEGLDNLSKVNNSVDYIITHTTSLTNLDKLSKLPYIDKDLSIEERPLNKFLDKILSEVSYKHHYFGHFHLDVDISLKETGILNKIRVLDTGKIVKEW